MSHFSKKMFLMLCFIHLGFLFAVALPLPISLMLAMVPVLVMSKAVMREMPNVWAMKGMCGFFIALDLLLLWAGYGAVQANRASAEKGGGLMGGWGEILMAAAVLLAILSGIVFALCRRSPSPEDK